MPRPLPLCVWLALSFAGLGLAGCGGGGRPALTVLAASSLEEALEAYDGSFAGAAVRSSFAGSDQLAAQVRQGAPADVFASADTGYPAALRREGLAEKPVVFARNRLVVIASADGSVRSLADLARPGTSIAIGDPSVPVGRYTRAVLARLAAPRRAAILANVRSEEPEAGSVVAKVADGAAEAGFVYVTDARAAAGQVRQVPIPPRLQPDVAYAAAVLASAPHPALAHRYLSGLLRGAGAADLRRAGFLPPR